jgi:hypothetical protein
MGDWMDAQSLIACWELGRRRHPLDRALLLHAVATPDTDPDTLADRTLGERNAALLELRQCLFGDALKSCVSCPACDEKLEFAISAQALLERAPAIARTHVDLHGRMLRLPTTRDLASVASELDSDRAAQRLLDRLLDGNSGNGFLASAEAVTRTLDEADPRMDLSLGLSCPGCAHEWAASLDVPAFLWEEIEVRARRLLDEVHALARAYGWSERQILELSDLRRSAYLERVLA